MMKRIFVMTMLVAGLTAAYASAQMGAGHMMESAPETSEDVTYGDAYYPCPQMPGTGMTGYGGYGGYGMMGHMGGMMGGMIWPGYGGYMRGMMPPGYGGHMGAVIWPGYDGHMGGMMEHGYGRRMGGYWRGRDMMGYGPGDYQKYQKEYMKYLDDTAGLRKKLHNKKFDYYEALRNPDIDRTVLRKLERELRDLQWELHEKAPN